MLRMHRSCFWWMRGSELHKYRVYFRVEHSESFCWAEFRERAELASYLIVVEFSIPIRCYAYGLLAGQFCFISSAVCLQSPAVLSWVDTLLPLAIKVGRSVILWLHKIAPYINSKGEISGMSAITGRLVGFAGVLPFIESFFACLLCSKCISATWGYHVLWLLRRIVVSAPAKGILAMFLWLVYVWHMLQFRLWPYFCFCVGQAVVCCCVFWYWCGITRQVALRRGKYFVLLQLLLYFMLRAVTNWNTPRLTEYFNPSRNSRLTFDLLHLPSRIVLCWCFCESCNKAVRALSDSFHFCISFATSCLSSRSSEATLNVGVDCDILHRSKSHMPALWAPSN